MRQGLYSGLVLSAVALAVALGQIVPAVCGGAMPQAGGDDILLMVFGDARDMLSEMLVLKADEYFHGGVKNVVCDHCLSEGSSAHGEEHAHGDAGEEHEEHGAAVHESETSWNGDLWAWVDAQVHEQVHRHVEGAEAKELLPWLWGACRAAPGNVKALESTAYILDKMNNRPMEALELLDRGVSNNPGSASLEFSRGEIFFHSLHNAARAEAAFASAVAKCRPVEGPAGDDERLLQLRALFYLGYIANLRGDRAKAESCLRDAQAINPKHVTVENLRKLLHSE